MLNLKIYCDGIADLNIYLFKNGIFALTVLLQSVPRAPDSLFEPQKNENI